MKKKARFLIVILVFAGLFSASLCSAKTTTHKANKKNHDKAVSTFNVPIDTGTQCYTIRLAEKSHIDPKLVFAMMKVESDYDPHCISDHGESIGILQVQPKWHKERMDRLHAHDMLNVRHNIKVAIDYLSYLYKRYGDTNSVLMAYNGGEPYMFRMHRKGIYETSYIRQVRRVRSKIHKVKNKRKRKHGK